MSEELLIPEATIESWLGELKPYQANTLRELLRTNDPEQAAKAWLSSNGPQNTIQFGGVGDRNAFWDQFIEEFNAFVCDDRSYSKEKKTLVGETASAKMMLISTISGVLGAKLGFSAALLAPAITLTLAIVGKMGRNAYCKTRKSIPINTPVSVATQS